jgi:pimeloyl-ACP methyl ester carboxylesterase
MPLLSVVRVIFAVLSLAILVAAGFLLWTWYQGDLVQDTAGVVHRVRHDWQLWTGAGLLAWSLLGRFVARLVLARADRDPMRAERSEGQRLAGANGAVLHVETVGSPDAPPVILTHGWSLDSTAWFYARRDLAKRFQVITWDLPGLGKSTRRPDGIVSMPDFAQDLATVIGLTGGRPAVLVGHSIGGMIIQTLARDRPEMFGREVAGVVLLNTTYTNPLKTMILSGLAQLLRWPVIEPMMRLKIWLQPLAWLSSWQSYLSGSAHISARFGFGRYVTRSQLDHTALMMTRNPPAVSARGDLAMFRWDSAQALARLNVPSLVIGGSVDIVTKPEASRAIAATMPHARIQIIEGVNHMGFMERADIYDAAIAKFAESVQQNG